MTARMVGWIVKRLGFAKRRLPHDGRHIVVWDADLAFRLTARFGIPLLTPISLEKTSPPSLFSPQFVAEGDIGDNGDNDNNW
jgi:hypothetical protein